MSIPSGAKSISVVIPVKNEAAKIRDCLDGLLSQTVPVEEIVVLDSGSTDGTLDILAEYPRVRVVRVAPEDFNHGETRNRGVREARGERVLLTVGDARAADDRWIERLLEGFTDEAGRDDPEVAAVCGAQVVPHELDKNPAVWFRPQSEPEMTRYQFSTPEAFHRLPPAEQKRACSWDDVTALYRRDVLLDIPFRRTTYAEDAAWAKDALERGHALVYNPAARVYHYHARSYDFAFKRTLTASYHRYQTFGLAPEEPALLMPYLRSLYILLREPRLGWADRAYWAWYNARARLGIYRALQAFRAAQQQGDAALRRLHERHCGKPPIPEKKAAPVS